MANFIRRNSTRKDRPRVYSANYLASLAAEKAARDADRARERFKVLVETVSNGEAQVSSAGRFQTREAAEAEVANHRIGWSPRGGFDLTRVWIEEL